MIDLRRQLFLARRDVRNALARYRRMSPGRIIADMARARRLRNAGAKPVATSKLRLDVGRRVVVSLTTIPERVDLIGPALRGLMDQTLPADRIILAWPRASRRSGAAYPEPRNIPAGVDIVSCEDAGPATKLLPALQAEPDALIIVADDDVIYPRDFIESLVRAHLAEPRAALGYRGWRLQAGRTPREFDHIFATALTRPEDVDILLGTWGYLLPPGSLNGAVHDFSGFPDALRWVDDVWISGHLMRRGVLRRVIPARGLPIEARASFVAALTDGPNRSGENDLAAIAAFAPWR